MIVQLPDLGIEFDLPDDTTPEEVQRVAATVRASLTGQHIEPSPPLTQQPNAVRNPNALAEEPYLYQTPREVDELFGIVRPRNYDMPRPKIRKADREFCGAKTRAGGTCQARVVPGKRRCRMHGGLSTGARTMEGMQRAKANLKPFGRKPVSAVSDDNDNPFDD